MVLLGLLVAVVLGAVVLGGIARGVGGARRAAERRRPVGARGRPRHARRLPARLRAERARRRRQPAPPRARRVPRARRGTRHGRPRRATAPTTSPSPSPAAELAPIRVRGHGCTNAIAVGKAEVANAATAEAELAPPGTDPSAGALTAGEYRGPVSPHRQGQADAPRRRAGPSIAWPPPPAPDRLALLITSAFRSDAEQARPLHRATPIPSGSRPRAGRCIASAPSSTSARPPAYRWLAANAEKFHFLQRYSWETVALRVLLRHNIKRLATSELPFAP